jgi:signal transduction histidine kinase
VIWSDRSRLALSIGAATLVPVAALAWLGLRVLQQDRDIERQRRRERLEVAAGRLALELERQLQDTEDRLARGDGIRLLSTGLLVSSSPGVLYQPEPPTEVAPAPPTLTAAEQQEFQARNLGAAAGAYRDLLRHSTDPAVRAGALVGLARVLRQSGDGEGALRAYADLEQLGSVRVGGQPAALVALQGRCKVLEESSDTAGLRRAVDALARAINAGAWPIDRATFALYRDMLDRWGAAATPVDALVRTDAAIRIWQTWRAGDLPPRGRRVLRTDRGSALAAWAGEAASPRLWLATPAYLDAQLGPLRKNLDLRVSIFDADGAPLVGDAATAGSLSLTPAETRLPFVLSIAPGGAAVDGSDALRRRLVLGGLVGVIGLILAAAYGLYRATARELLLARQQSDFVSAVSHEFRTPLTSMRHLTDLLVSRGVTSEERRTHYYGLLAHETERLYRMVEALLSFGRIEAGAYAFCLEPVAPSGVVESVVEEFRSESLARGREISCDVDPSLPSILADRETLARALWNLIENAAKYSAPGTPIRVFAARSGDFVLLGVGDRGDGVAPAERDRIFQKFVRGADAKRSGVRGVGIGLALVKRIVEAHGGSVRVESEPGRGSTFTLVLPAEVRLKADATYAPVVGGVRL